MRYFGKMVLAFGVVALLVAPAMAQRPGGGFGGFGGGGGAMLVGNKSVQQEVKATDAQVEKLNALAQEVGEKQREQFQKLQDLSQEQRREKMTELTQTMNADLRKSLVEILKPEQIKRFEQIQVQQAGLNAFATPRVQETLKLNDDQRSKIREMIEEQNQAMRDAFQGGAGGNQSDRQAAMQKLTEMRKRATEKALALLTDSQRTSYKELTGEPFEIRLEPPRRPNQ